MGQFVPVGGLWEKQDKYGRQVFSGKLDKAIPAGAKLWISLNAKRTDRQPTHQICIIEDDQPAATSTSRAPEPPPDYEQRHPPAAHVTPVVGRVVTHDGPRMPMGKPANLSRRKTDASDLNEPTPF